MAAQFGVESEEDLRLGRLLEAQTGGRPIELAEPSLADDPELVAEIDAYIAALAAEESSFTAPPPAPGWMGVETMATLDPEVDRMLRQLEEMGPSSWQQR
ncbi:MAG: hypothetical protein ACREN1_10005 [Candidatus Dormibacteria bacterium]